MSAAADLLLDFDPQAVEAPRTSVLVRALEDAWSDISNERLRLPGVVIVIAPVSLGGRYSKYGHYAGMRWSADRAPRAEVLIAAEGLERGARAVFETLLHESVHAYQDATDERGTSRQGRYHNKAFARRAEEFGLVVEAHPTIGHVTPDISEECAEHYSKAIERIEDALRITRGVEQRGRTQSRNGKVLVCGCDRKVRISDTTAEEGPIICGRCREEFLLEGSRSGVERNLPRDDDLAKFVAMALGEQAA